MTSITTSSYAVHFNSVGYQKLNAYLRDHRFSKLFIIVDTNTHTHCLPHFMAQLETNLECEIIEIEAGETHKNIDTCIGVWNALTELGADRKSLIINVGGGVVTDLGGFVACTFKRGLKYINVPTSLLAMVDASVGGKTGVDLGALKNQIGIIASGDMVIIDSHFLSTLPQNHLKSGLAEMLKHGLIYDLVYWDKLQNLNTLYLEDFDGLIHRSVEIKNDIVTADPFEQGLRKTLNFGHTLGHAIESYYLSKTDKEELLHGEAIAIGMIMEAYLSTQLLNFPKDHLETIKQSFLKVFPKVSIETADYEPIIDLLKYDKKNEHGNINFVLLETIGTPKVDCLVENELLLEAFAYYKS